MKTQHTPGPYFAQQAFAVSGCFRPWSADIRSKEFGCAVATAYGDTQEQAEANAALFAAAPMLLEALQCAEKRLAKQHAKQVFENQLTAGLDNDLAHIRAAIANAEGQTA